MAEEETGGRGRGPGLMLVLACCAAATTMRTVVALALLAASASAFAPHAGVMNTQRKPALAASQQRSTALPLSSLRMGAEGRTGGKKFVGKAAAFTAAASIALSGGAMAALRSNPNLQTAGPQVEHLVAHGGSATKSSNPLASFLKVGAARVHARGRVCADQCSWMRV